MNDEKIKQRLQQGEKQKLNKCTFKPEVHKVDKEIFKTSAVDKSVKEYFSKKSVAKDRAKQIEEINKKNKMKL